MEVKGRTDYEDEFSHLFRLREENGGPNHHLSHTDIHSHRRLRPQLYFELKRHAPTSLKQIMSRESSQET